MSIWWTSDQLDKAGFQAADSLSSRDELSMSELMEKRARAIRDKMEGGNKKIKKIAQEEDTAQEGPAARVSVRCRGSLKEEFTIRVRVGVGVRVHD